MMMRHRVTVCCLTALLLAAWACCLGCDQQGAQGPAGKADAQKKLNRELFAAARSGKADLIENLVKEGADVNAPTSQGTTPLVVAAKLGRTDAVKALLESGADPNIGDKFGRMPLHWGLGQKETVEHLLNKGADVDATGKEGATALHVAAQRGEVEAAGLLIAKGADVNAKDNGGKTPLQMAKHPMMGEPSQAMIDFLVRNGATE